MRAWIPTVPAGAALALCLTGCVGTNTTPGTTSAPTTTPPAASNEATVAVAPPPADAALDYQLGGAYDPPAGVGIVVRDRSAPPAAGVYSICYVNGFQTQPDELDLWPDDLLLHGPSDGLVYDPDWPDEAIVDTSDPAAVAEVVTPCITACADADYDAVEFDNLDTYTRTDGALERADAVALATLLVAAAHGAGLAAGQKNAAEDAALLHDSAGFDFAVTEECVHYDECAAYTDVYGAHVLAIEYSDQLTAPLPQSWADVCAAADRPASIVLRDRDLVTPDDPDYVFALCD